MKNQASPRAPQSWEHLLEKDPHSSTGFRVGLVAALFLHGVIFAVTWPTIAQAPPKQPEQVFYPYPITEFRPTPPEPEEIRIDLPVNRTDGQPIIDGEPEEVEFETVINEFPPPPKGPDVVVVHIPDPPPDLPDPPPTIVDSYQLVEPPVVKHRVEPRYTEAARHAKKEGVVILDLVIDTEGRVESIKVMRGLPLGLTESAVEAVQQWVFQPSTYRENPVAVRYVLTVRFNLT